MDSLDTSTLLVHWFVAFVLSLALEVPVFVAVSRGRVRTLRAMWAGAAGTCLTHPLLWFVWPYAVDGFAAYTVSGELIVAALESLIFYALARPIRLIQAVAASFLANGVSYGGGILLHWLGLLA